MSDVKLTDAEVAWIAYRNDIQKRSPWENHRRQMRRLRKRDFIAGYEAAAARVAEAEAKALALEDFCDAATSFHYAHFDADDEHRGDCLLVSDLADIWARAEGGGSDV